MNILTKYKKVIGNILFILFVALILALSIRGLPGNPTPKQLNTLYWKENGPFELSNERGRYALTYSIVENHSLHFQPAIANFAAPDVGYLGNSYVSLFAPSISFVAIPGYIIGKYFGIAQFGTFAWMAIFALLNVLLIRAISIKLGASSPASSIAGLTFLFASPAFAYAVTVYEHHVSTFLILLSLYLLIRYKSIISLITIWILYAFAFTVDYPNLFMMLPIAVAAFFKSFNYEYFHKKFTLNFSLPRAFAVLGVIIPLAFFLWFNQASYNNPLTISGSVARVLSVKSNGLPIYWGSNSSASNTTKTEKTKTSNLPPAGSVFNFFVPRNMLNGFYILFISPDRGILMYTPVMVLGILGVVYASKRKQKYIPVLAGIMGFDFILYSMWGDPYGGWAFGARYLIPAYAISSIFIAQLLTYWGRKRLFLVFFFVIFSYSVMVNTLGALTSNGNPPKIEAEAISNISHQPVSYTYMRNINDLNSNVSRSFVFQAYGNSYFSAWDYFTYIALFILIVSSFFIMSFYITTKKNYLQGGQHAL